MLKKTITFEDLDGNKVTEDFYFNLTKPEIVELEVSYEGGLVEHLKRIGGAEKPNGALIMSTFKDLLVKSVGRRSEDGRRFIKNQQITDEFFESDAYSVFFMELVTDAEAGATFVNGVMPRDLVAKMQEDQATTTVSLPNTVTPADAEIPAWKKENRKPTTAELQAMSPEELREAWKAQENNPS